MPTCTLPNKKHYHFLFSINILKYTLSLLPSCKNKSKICNPFFTLVDFVFQLQLVSTIKTFVLLENNLYLRLNGRRYRVRYNLVKLIRMQKSYLTAIFIFRLIFPIQFIQIDIFHFHMPIISFILL